MSTAPVSGGRPFDCASQTGARSHETLFYPGIDELQNFCRTMPTRMLCEPGSSLGRGHREINEYERKARPCNQILVEYPTVVPK